MPVTLDQRALTTLEAMRRHLRISDDAQDDLLTELINATTAWIERLCRRRLAAEDARALLPLTGHRVLRLPQYPLLRVDRIAVGSTPALALTFGGDALEASVSVDDEGVRLRSLGEDGTSVTTALAAETYPTLGLLAEAAALVAGWEATVVADGPSTALLPTGGAGALGETATLDAALEPAPLRRVEMATGLLELATARGTVAHPELVMVHYRAGLDPVPDDLSLAARLLAADVFHRGRHDAAALRESLGDWAVQIAPLAELTTMQRALLAPYTEIR